MRFVAFRVVGGTAMSGVGWGGFGGSERRGIPPIRMKPRMDGAPGYGSSA